MQLIVDLHIHSQYSRATSKQMNVAQLYKWGKIKGINIIGTGDFTHPAWVKELKEKLEPAENGLFKLKEKYAKEQDALLPESVRGNLIRFILTVEISNIYKKHDKVRKMHNVLVAPSFEAVAEVNSRLDKIGNIKSDGRPILGLDSKELLKISMESDPDSFFFPAHIWTPWFSMFGSKSGFDTIEEAFEELAPEIKAIETGLSSDPFMNWRLSQLDGLTILSHSDAHSPQKLGREANVMDCKVDYKDIIGAVKTNDKRMIGTIEFYPEEGKYHFDGHRKCNFRCLPEETKKLKGICPKCGKPLVVGVHYRVEEIADRDFKYRPKKHKKVEYIIPLAEMIAEVKGVKGVNSKTVQSEYEAMYAKLGDEFSILRTIATKEIQKAGFAELAVGIKRMRKGEVNVDPGYDGVFGVIKVFGDEKGAKRSIAGQVGMGL